MKELLEVIAKNLVDNPDQVSVSEVKGERSIILELKVAPDDMGKGHRQAGQDRQGYKNCS